MMTLLWCAVCCFGSGIIVYSETDKVSDVFMPNVQSLQQYETPEWFSETEFGRSIQRTMLLRSSIGWKKELAHEGLGWSVIKTKEKGFQNLSCGLENDDATVALLK